MIALVGPGAIHQACYWLPTVLLQKPLSIPLTLSSFDALSARERGELHLLG